MMTLISGDDDGDNDNATGYDGDEADLSLILSRSA